MQESCATRARFLQVVIVEILARLCHATGAALINSLTGLGMIVDGNATVSFCSNSDGNRGVSVCSFLKIRSVL